MSMWNRISGLLVGWAASQHQGPEPVPEQGDLQGRGVTRTPSNPIEPGLIESIESGRVSQVGSEREPPSSLPFVDREERPSSLPFVDREELQRHESEEGEDVLLPSPCFQRAGSGEGSFSSVEPGAGRARVVQAGSKGIRDDIDSSENLKSSTQVAQNPSQVEMKSSHGESSTRMYMHWTNEDDRQLTELVEKGYSDAQIAPYLRRTEDAVKQRRLKGLNLKKEGDEPFEWGSEDPFLGWEELHKATIRQAITNGLTDSEVCFRFTFGNPGQMRSAVAILRSELSDQINRGGSRGRRDRLVESAGAFQNEEDVASEPRTGSRRMAEDYDGEEEGKAQDAPNSTRDRPLKKRRVWTEEDESLLRELFEQCLNDEQIARRLGRSRESVSLKRGKIGLRRREFVEKWSKKQISQLRQLVEQGVPYLEIASQLQRTLQAVRSRAQALGLHSKTFWQPWEEEELRRGVANGETVEMIQKNRLPHRGFFAISNRRFRLDGSKRTRDEVESAGKRRRVDDVSDEEKE